MSQPVQVIQPPNVLDSAYASQLHQDIQDALQSGPKVVLVDLEDTTFIDSSGLGALVTAFKSARNANSKLVLCSVSAQARMLLEITGTDQVFEVFPSQDEFHKALAANSESASHE